MARERAELNGVAAVYRARELAERQTAPSDEAFRGSYPTLFSILTNRAIDGERTIDAVYWRVSIVSGDWHLSVGIPALGAYTEVAAGTFQDGLAKLESHLATNPGGWRFNTNKPIRVRKKAQQKKDG